MCLQLMNHLLKQLQFVRTMVETFKTNECNCQVQHCPNSKFIKNHVFNIYQMFGLCYSNRIFLDSFLLRKFIWSSFGTLWLHIDCFIFRKKVKLLRICKEIPLVPIADFLNNLLLQLLASTDKNIKKWLLTLAIKFINISRKF